MRRSLILILLLVTSHLMACKAKSSEYNSTNQNNTIEAKEYTPCQITISEDSMIALFKKIKLIETNSYFKYKAQIVPSKLVIKKLSNTWKIIVPEKDTQSVTFKKNYFRFNIINNNKLESFYISFIQYDSAIFILFKSNLEQVANCIPSTNSLFKYYPKTNSITNLTDVLNKKIETLYTLPSSEKSQSLFRVSTFTEGLELLPNLRCLEFNTNVNITLTEEKKLIPIEEILTW
jgi:hypothetical protein